MIALTTKWLPQLQSSEDVIIHGKDLSLSDCIMHSCSQLTQLHREIHPCSGRAQSHS